MNSAPPPPGDSESPRDTARSAADEEANTTGLVGAPDPDADSSDAAARRDRAARDSARTRDGVRGRLQSVELSAVPPSMRATAAWAWRIVAVAAAVYVVLIVLSRMQVVVVPLAVALLLSALLQP